jgi:pimeloyl-ACP methyl ester carboxylesterase
MPNIGKDMRSCVTILFSLIAVLIGHIAAAAGNDLGTVLLHGKGGAPSGYIHELASVLQSRGYLVSTPTMPWSQNRIYDASFEEAMTEIDREIDSLRHKGARFVVVAGHSLGANAALGYASSRGSVAGVIALAPAHTPDLQGFIRRVGQDVNRARALVEAGKGKEKHRFSDVNQGRVFQVTATPEVYLSWFDPDGPAVMPRSAATFKVPTPLLLVVGSNDRTAQEKDYIFDKAPPHAKSKFVSVAADHFTVPSAAIGEVVTWLSALSQ